ncbi:MAG: hypothetical protein ACI9OJ_002305 [Myxococcota bacterium]
MAKRVLFFLLMTYLAVAGGHAYSGDGVLMLRVTESMVTRGETSVRPIEGFTDYAVAGGQDDALYAKYGLGLSVAAVPLYAVGRSASDWIPDAGLTAFDAPKILYYDRANKLEVISSFFGTLTNALIMALTMALLALLLIDLGLPPRWAAGWAIAVGLSGVMPFYAKTFFSEPLAGLLLVACALAIRRAGAADPGQASPKWLLFAGFCLGASALTRVAHLALAIPALLAFAFWLRAHRKAGHRLMPAAGAVVLGFAVPCAVLLSYNAVRFGSAFETGYGAEVGAFDTNPITGLGGLLFSAGRGLVWYVPWSIAGLLGLRALFKVDRSMAVFCGGSMATLMALYSGWHMWEGGWCFGPRFLVPALPLLAVPAALFVYERRERPATQLVAALLLAVSGALAFMSVRVNYIDYHYAIFQTRTDWESAIRWSLDVAPMVRYWDFPLKDFLIMPRFVTGEGGGFLRALGVAIVGLWVLAAGLLVSGLRRETAVQPDDAPA